MHTPEKARQLWCPMTRVARVEPIQQSDQVGVDAVVGGCNTDRLGGVRVPASCRCIADQCSMWRWAVRKPERIRRAAVPRTAASEKETNRPPGAEGFEFLPYDDETGDPAEWVEPQEMANARRLGCCGLAGVPSAY